MAKVFVIESNSGKRFSKSRWEEKTLKPPAVSLRNKDEMTVGSFFKFKLEM